MQSNVLLLTNWQLLRNNFDGYLTEKYVPMSLVKFAGQCLGKDVGY